MVQAILIAALAAYFLGNHNGAVVVSAWIAHDDVRSHGSGNAGLTNFLRSYGAKSALLVVAVDVLKTVLAVLLSGAMLQSYGYGKEGMMLGAVAVSLGHDYPMLLGFKGGKGILCGVTIALLIDWRVAAIIAAIFFACVLLTGYVSLGSVLAAAAFAISFACFYWQQPWMVAGGIFMGALAIWMHRSNIQRLLKGTENKFSIGKKEKNA